ncbi:SdrD B-like domain-containing protein [Methanolapillus millepedarum]
MIGLITILTLMLALAAPAAAAYNSTVTQKWDSGTTGIQTISPNTGNVVSFKVNVSDADGAGNYILNITLKNNNTSDPTTGFKFSDYTGKSRIPTGMEDIITSVTMSGNTITYTLTNPTVVTLDVLVWADVMKVYNNEEVVVDATLYKKGVSPAPNVQVADTVTAKAICKYPVMHCNGDFELTNPTIMPSNASTIDLNYLFYTESDWTTFRAQGLLVNNLGYTLNFSNVTITADGVTKTYSQWLSGGSSPVVFRYKNGTSANDMSLTFAASDLSILTWQSRMPFQIVTTDDFKYNGTTSPSINFANLTVDAKVKINGRGPQEDLYFHPADVSNKTGSLFNYSGTTTSATSTAEKDSVTRIRFIGPISQISSSVIANSEQYTSGTRAHLYYQELFRIGFTGSIRDGEDVNVTVAIPNGVTVTHLRLPSSDNRETQYTSITVSDPYSHSITYDNSSRTVNLSADGLEFHPGDDVNLTITGLLKMKPAPGASYSYTSECLIHFVGTTNSSVADNTNLPFSGTVKRLSNAITVPAVNFSEVAKDKYYVTPYITSTSTMLYNSITAVNVGDSFYLFETFRPSPYPYYSAHRTSVSDPDGTSVYSNPVFYFSVPPQFTIKSAAFTYANGTAAKDSNGNALSVNQTIYDNAGLYKDMTYNEQHGKVVEVKIKSAGTAPDENFWLNYANYLVKLELEVPADYDGAGKVTFAPQTVLVTTWDSQAVDSATGGSGGSNKDLAAANITGIPGLHAVNGAYSGYLTNRDLSILIPNTVSVYVSTNTPGGYLSYNPSNPQSFPELKAGSSNEDFKLYINNRGGENFSDVKAYYILPKNTGWKSTLNQPPQLDLVKTNAATYKVYYTTDAVESETIQNNGNLAGTYNWTLITFDSTPGTGTGKATNIDDANLTNITAIKCEFSALKNGEHLTLHLPFKLPKVGGAVAYDQTAIGQTLYYFNASFKSSNAFTGAVKLVKSDFPALMGNSSGTPIALEISNSTAYQTGTIPNWWDVYTYDDFTENISLTKVSVKFVPTVGNPITHPPITTGFTNTSYTPTGPDHVDGYLTTVSALDRSIVNTSTPGTYTITYTSSEDDDSQAKVANRTIVITKDIGTLTLTGGSTDIFWKSDIPSGSPTWNDYFKTFVSGTDFGNPISQTDIMFKEYTGAAFNISEPGNYVLVYRYTDSALNEINASVNVAVKYRGNISGTVTGNGQNVTSWPVAVNSGSATTNSSGKYTYLLEANTTNPLNVPYSVNLTTAPAGLKAPTAVTGTASITNENPVVNFTLTPVTINATFTDPSTWIDSVSLYSSDGTLVQKMNTSENGGHDYFLFEKASGQGWFEAGDYYLEVAVKPGYKTDIGNDFNVFASSVLKWQTTNFTLGNDDIVKAGGNAVDAPVISGTVWNDANQDSVKDVDEAGISGAAVNLLDSSSTVLETATTDTDGYYYFVESPVSTMSGSYHVQVNLPSEFNTASAFQFDQKINASNNYSSDLIDIQTSDFQFTDIHAGFYHKSGGNNSGGIGNATIVPMTEPMKGENKTEEPRNESPGFEEQPTPEPTNGKVFSLFGLILMVLSVLLALPQLYDIYRIKGKGEESKDGNETPKSATFQILAVVLAVMAVIVFFLLYRISGEMVYYGTADLVLTVIFLAELAVTVKAYGKKIFKSNT